MDRHAGDGRGQSDGLRRAEPGCTTDWRVIKGSCWFRAFDSDTGRYSSSYCGEACCLEPFEVCFDEDGDVTCFEPQSSYPPGGLCQPSHCEPGACEPACGNPSWAEGGSGS